MTETNNSLGNNAKGSIWHRWDPHIHTPGTILNDQYTGVDPWDDFLSRIEKSVPHIKALGITDYYSVDCYEKTLEYKKAGRLHYKASGTPWALIRKDSAETTCYAGISFFKSRDKKTTQTSLAQIFNELGKGIILRGEEVELKKNDRTPHLTAEQAFNLLHISLKEYYEAVKIFPKRLVLHKTSNYNADEIYGFRQAAKELHINQTDLISIQPADIRLYRQGSYPPMRGTHFSITDENHILYTRGSVPYYETYPGKYIPSPLEIKFAAYDESPNIICDEILSLTKMNWNNTQFDRKYPITIECARNVGEILKYLKENDTMQLKYSFYM